MTPVPQNRRKLVRALTQASDSTAARRVARSAKRLCDERAARLLLERFKPLPLDERSRAEAVARAAGAIAEVDGGAVCRAIALRLSGVLDHLAGKASSARRRLEKSAVLFTERDLAVDAGDVQRILIDVLMRTEDYAGAKLAAQRSRKCYATAGGADRRRMGSLEMNLGNLHHRRDEHRQALRAYARARRLFLKAKEPLHLAIVDYNRANILTMLDRTREARQLYDRARGVFVRRKLPALMAQADFALASIDLAEGRLDPCLTRLMEARERLAALGDSLRVAHAELDAADAFLRLNRPADAAEQAQSAAEFFRRAGQLAELAACMGMRAGAALQEGRPRQAARLFSRGRQLQERLKNPVAAALLEIGQAQAELQGGRADRAIGMARRAARVLATRKLGSRQARALAVGAEAALKAGRRKLARDWATQARSLARRYGDLRVELAALLVQGKLEEQAGNPTTAYRRLLAAERCVERLRRGITTEESRLAFALDKSEVFEALILNRLERGDRRSVRQALVFAERGKARALAERLAEGRPDVLATGSPQARRLLARLTAVEQKLALAESRLQDPEALAGLRGARIANIDELTRSRMRTLDALSRRDPQRAALVGAPAPDPTEAIRRLRPNELVLEYVQAGGDFHLFAIDRNGIEAFPKLAPVGQVHQLVELLRFQLSKGVLGEAHAARFGRYIEATLRRYLEPLHDLLLGPVAARLDGKHVRFVPHGILHGLPFHALESGGSAVVDRCIVSYIPSLTTISLIPRGAAPASAPVVLGVPDRAAPLIEREVEAVRRHARQSRVFRGSEATRRALRLGGRRPAFLHVACHGFYSEDRPWNSGLRLGDAWLSLPELYGMRDTAHLVVLSGCKTGRGTVYSGDEWVGLVRGFLQAGARSVVASLWEVHDRCAVTLMESFYEGLAAGRGVAEALALAQRTARREDPMPLRWAPFVIVGEPDLRIGLRKVA